MTGSRRSCFFILPNFMPFLLLLFLISLLLLHGGASSVEATTTACSNRTKAGDCVSVANRRIEDEDEAPAGAGQFLDSLGQVAHFTYGALKPPPVCNSQIYANCYVGVNPHTRGCKAYDRCR
nr:protein RALF-like 27 [Ipomoea batatas]GMD55356.1 protein RALF-like 27 [Ipomoea batatas]GMD58747.1 protein RALF-like 27 [Ipomoea batatas]